MFLPASAKVISGSLCKFLRDYRQENSQMMIGRMDHAEREPFPLKTSSLKAKSCTFDTLSY